MRQNTNQLLAAVSRSFYLTIRVLPPFLREPVGLAYLLARMSDTVADSAAAPAQERIALLDQMGEALQGRRAMPDFAGWIAGVPDPSERALLAQAEALFAQFQAATPDDRAEIAWVMREILRGQRLDLLRFGSASEGGVRALATAEELEDYTYSVAGCVGVFWTRICSRHLPAYAPGIAPEALCALGAAFGKGLQLVNILRDAPTDLANGRCYFPADELDGIDPEALRGNPALARPVFARWLARARQHLDAGLQYVQAVRPWRLRLACFLPWALGVRTLRLLEQTPPLETARRVKVPRKEVRALLFWGILAGWGNGALRIAAGRVQRPRFPQ